MRATRVRAALLACALLVLAAPAAAEAPPEVPSDENANVVDPFGDANYVNDQGTDRDTGVFIGNGVTPVDTAAVADIGKVWFTETEEAISVHVQTEAKGPATAGLLYRVQVDPGTGTRCLWFQAATAGIGNLGGNGATLRDTCPSPVPTSTGTISFSDGPDATGIITLTFPLSAHPALAGGKVLGSPAAHSRNFAAIATAPQIDNTLPGTDYKISEGADPDPSPTPTTSPSPDPSPTDGGTRGSYPEVPDDPYFGEDSADPIAFDPTQWALRKVQAPQAWQQARATGFGIRVAVLDTGVDLQHEDLQCAGKLDVGPGSDVVTNDSNPDDEHGHGTHVAGIVGACTNNGTGVAGVAPDATIVPVRVLNAAGSGTDAQLIAGLDKATELGVHVINMSLGYIPGKEIINNVSAIDAAIGRARDAGIVLVAAAGNDSFPLCEYPALAEDVICVGATDPRDLKSFYSVFPNKTDAEDTIGPGLVAPGGSGAPFCDTYAENVLSTIPLEFDTNGCTDVQGYANNFGTSMAAPHVAGVAALVYDRLGGERSSEAAAEVIAAIIEGADDLGAPGYDPVFGWGRLNASKAVQAVAVGPDPTPTPTPTGEPTPTPTPTESPAPDTPDVSFTGNSATSAQYSDKTLFEARLTDSGGDPVEGAELAFELTGAESSRTFPATTDADGVASVSPTLDEMPGPYQLTVRYAGDGDHEPSADTTSFVVDKEDSALDLSETKGKDKSLVARLSDGDTPTTGIVGRTIDFYAGSELIGSATTDEDGVTTFEPPKQKGKKEPYEAHFEGDDFYLASSDRKGNGKG